MTNALSFKRDANAILLPNSALYVIYSTQFFRLVPEADPSSLVPDVPVALSSADYRAGRDPVLEAILARVGP